MPAITKKFRSAPSLKALKEKDVVTTKSKFPRYFIKDRADNQRSILPEDVDWAIVANYEYVLEPMTALSAEILHLKTQAKYKRYLEVPPKYKRAYRLLTDVFPQTMKKIVGREPKEDKAYTYKGGKYTPHEGRDHASWTVDKSMFARVKAEGEKHTGLEFADTKCKPGTYVVLLEVDLDAHRAQFAINPDTIFSVVSMKRADTFLKSQREIVSFGQVPLAAIHYVYVRGGTSAKPEHLLPYTQKIHPRLGTAQ